MLTEPKQMKPRYLLTLTVSADTTELEILQMLDKISTVDCVFKVAMTEIK